jgi:hypothetical protein
MVAYEPLGAGPLGGWITLAGLRPEPQGAVTQAAGAASQGIGVDARNSEAAGKTVFGRHSTQSSIAAEGTEKRRGFKGLVVDTAVYATAGSVYAETPNPSQVPEYRPTPLYTGTSATGLRSISPT